MDLYFILIAIAGVGILSLILLGWGRIRLPRKENFSSLVKKTELTEKPKNIEPIIATTAISETGIENPADEVLSLNDNSDNALAQLGFSALDGLIVEAENMPSISALDEPLVTTTRIKSVSPSFSPNPKIDLIIFYLMAPAEKPFLGYELLQALFAVGLRFGDMNIFHYYEHAEESPTILFSVASAVEPGIFDMANIGAFSCPGLSIFMSGKKAEHPEEVFEKLIETAYQLAEDLQGVLYDDERKVLTDAKVASYRAKLHSMTEFTDDHAG